MSSDQHMKKLMSLREGLHVMMKCDMPQYVADRCWLHGRPRRHTCIVERVHNENSHKRIDHVICARTCVQMEHSEDSIGCNQNRLNVYVKRRVFFTKYSRIKKALESYSVNN